MASRKQNAANRRNAQLSTGPQTPEGKAAVRLNALRHGLTAQHAVISTEEQEDFNQTLHAFEVQLNPRGPLEALLVQQIVMAAWRLARLRGMETGLFELRLIDDAEDIDEDYEHLTPQTRLAYVFLHDARGPDAFTTLARYETRIERALYRALHELQRLQAARSGRDVPPPAALDVLAGEPPEPQNMSVTKQTQSPPQNPPNPAPPQDLPPSSISQSPNLQITQSPIPSNHQIPHA